MIKVVREQKIEPEVSRENTNVVWLDHSSEEKLGELHSVVVLLTVTTNNN